MSTFVTSDAGVFHVANDEHEDACQEAADGETTLEYRDWDIVLWPDTPMVGKNKDQQATARAVPQDEAKLPRPGASMSAGRFQAVESGDPKHVQEMQMRQVLRGLNRVLAQIDAVEDGD